MNTIKLNLSQLITLVSLVAMSAISTDLYLSGLPQIIEVFESDHAAVQLTLSIFLFGLAIGQLITGPLSDQYGRIPILKVGLAIYIVASISCLFVPSIKTLWIMRFVQGLAASCGPVLARAIVSDLYPRQQAAKILAYLSSAMALIPSLAPILGSIALYWFDWRSHFVLLALFGVILFAAVSLKLPETHLTSEKHSFAQSLGFIFANIGTLFRDKIYLGYVACGSVAHGAMFAYISSSSYLVTGLLGVAEQNFGYTFAVVALGYITGAFLSARLVTHFSIVHLLAIGFALQFTAVGLLLLQQNITLFGLLSAMFLIFAAGGFLIANAQAAAITRFKACAGAASAVFGFIQISTAAGCGVLAGIFYNDTVLPLTLIINGCACFGATVWYIFLYRSTEKNNPNG